MRWNQAITLAVMLTVGLPAWADNAPAAANTSVDVAGPATTTTAPAPPTPAAAQTDAQLQRVRDALAKVLANLGVPGNAARKKTTRRLDALASQAAQLAQTATDQEAQLQARNLQVQASFALLRSVGKKDRPQEYSYRLDQVRSAAAGAKRIGTPQARVLGDFWQLQADLIDSAQTTTSLDARQRQAIARLQAFDHQQPQPTTALERAVIGQVHLALLRLYDQRGLNRQLCALARDTSLTNRPAAADWTGDCDLIGQRLQAHLRLTDGHIWSLADRHGQAVLIAFVADWAPADASADDVRDLLISLRDAGKLGVLAVRLPDRSADQAQPAAAAPAANQTPAAQTPADAAVWASWPTYREGPGQVSLVRMFKVRSLPRYVLVGSDGRVLAIGGSFEVLRRLPAARNLDHAAAPAKPAPDAGANDRTPATKP